MEKEGTWKDPSDISKKKQEEGFFDKSFEKLILYAYILIFLVSFTHKFGGYYYDIVPWVFFGGLLLAAGFNVIGMLMFPVAIIYQTFFYGTMTFLPIALTTLYFIVALGVFFVNWSTKKLRLSSNAALVLVLILGVMAFLSTVFNGHNIGFGNSEFTHYLEAIMIFLVVAAFVNTKKRLRLFCWILLLAIASIAFRYYNHAFTYDIALPGFENNYLARVFSFYVPFFLGFFWAEKKIHLRVMILIVLALVVQGITQLGSRATYLSLALVLPFMFLKNLNKMAVWGFGVLGIVYLLFFAPPMLIDDFRSITYALEGTETSELSIQGRALVAQYGWETFKSNPLIGYGIYPAVFENVMLQRYDWYKSGHNSFIIVAVEMGIVGLIVYTFLFMIGIVYAYKAHLKNKNDDPYLSNISQGVAFGLAALAINQFMLNNPWIPTAFIGFGLSSALHGLSKTRKMGKLKIPRYIIVLFMLFFILAIVFLMTLLLYNLFIT